MRCTRVEYNQCEGFVSLGAILDAGKDHNEQKLATDALIFRLVGVNGRWKFAFDTSLCTAQVQKWNVSCSQSRLSAWIGCPLCCKWLSIQRPWLCHWLADESSSHEIRCWSDIGNTTDAYLKERKDSTGVHTQRAFDSVSPARLSCEYKATNHRGAFWLHPNFSHKSGTPANYAQTLERRGWFQ